MNRQYLMALAVAAFSLVVVGCSDDGDAELGPALRVGVLPDQSAEALRQRYEPLLEHLAEELGVSVELVIPESYADLLGQFVEERVDLAYFGGFTFAKARKRTGAVPLVMRDVDMRFTSYFLVASDNQAENASALKGARLAFGSELSTSGHLMPRYFMKAQGIDPENFFAEITYSGAHDATARLVANGEADLGVANANVVDAMFADGRLDRNKVRILWTTPPYADYVWVLRQGYSDSAQARLRQAFLGLSSDQKDHKEVLRRLGAGSFLPAMMDDFSQIISIAEFVEARQ